MVRPRAPWARPGANLALAFALIAAALVACVGIITYAKSTNALAPVETFQMTKLGTEYMVRGAVMPNAGGGRVRGGATAAARMSPPGSRGRPVGAAGCSGCASISTTLRLPTGWAGARVLLLRQRHPCRWRDSGIPCVADTAASLALQGHWMRVLVLRITSVELIAGEPASRRFERLLTGTWMYRSRLLS